MRDQIISRLKEIEKDHEIKILYSCESGSRAWEFPSPDSDFDVRFIYVNPVKNYLRITEQQDQLSFAINDELDIYGWDLRKTLQLTLKSNTTSFEWLQSPIVYGTVENFGGDLWELSQGYYNQRSNIHHYLGIARSALETVLNEDQIKIKKLFYVLRPLLAAKWCLQKNTIAPMSILPLKTLLPDSLLRETDDLIELKSTAAESSVVTISNTMRAFIDEQLQTISEASNKIPKQEFKPAALNDFFIRTILKYDH